MAYGIRPQNPVAAELRRVVRRQLSLAVGELSGPRIDDATVHEARRRIKKVRAALRLGREALGPDFRRENRRLRRAGRRIAAIAESESLVRTFDALAAAHPNQLHPPVVTAMRRHLRERLDAVDARAASDAVIEEVARRLRRGRQRADAWVMAGDGFELVAPGLRRTLRRSQLAMARAGAHATTRRYHAWRRRVKDHWLQLRLIGPCCADGLASDITRLAQLDELLGQAHDLALLAAVTMAGVPLARAEAAALLLVVHRDLWGCRRAALALGARVYADAPDGMLADLATAWQRRPAVAAEEAWGPRPRVA